MFETFYAGFVQHPILLWVAGALGLGYALWRGREVHPSVLRYAVVVALVSMVDAWLTTSDVPLLGPLEGAAATVIPLAFVLIGDFRYLVLAEAITGEGGLRFSARGIAVGVAWTFVVPVLAQLLVRFVFDSDEGRVLFLTYECLFFLLILARRRYVTRRMRAVHGHRWHLALDALALAWYGTWITADVVILVLELDVGYLIRVVPNLLYYGALPAVLVAGAPPRRTAKST